jgi:hypothetical protein
MAVAIIAAGAAAKAKWPHARWWLVVVTVATATVVPPAIATLTQVSQRRQEIGRTARAGLQGTAGAVGRKLPTAGTVDLEMRSIRASCRFPRFIETKKALFVLIFVQPES